MVKAWEEEPGARGNSHRFRIGPKRWIVGGAFYNAAAPKGSPNKYSAWCALPGIKERLGDFETPDEARARVQRAVAHWMPGAGCAPTE